MLERQVKEYQQREEALQRTEERLRLAQIGANMGAWEWDVRTGALGLTPELNNLWGQPSGTMSKYEDWRRRVHPEDIARIEAERDQAVAEHRPFQFEFRVVHGSGEIHWQLTKGSSLYDEQGRPVRVLGVNVDITERKRMEAALQQSEERLTLAFRAAREGIWDWDLESGTVFYSHRWKQMLGFGEEEIEPHPSAWERLLHPDDRSRVFETMKAVLSSGEQEFELEFRMMHRAGHYVHILARGVPVRRSGGGPVHRIVGTHFDLTERKKAQDALQAANAQLLEADRRKNEFMAMLSHELRNPLAPIKSSLYVLERAVPESDVARRAQAVIGRQVDQLAKLVDELLEVTRISRNKVTLVRERLELNELVRGVLEDYGPLFEKSGVRLTFSPAPVPLHVSGDRIRLAQIVGNLLQNAAKFTQRGGGAEVSLRLEGSKRQALLRVADTGVGMAPDILACLFQPFIQADRTLDRSQGGLGLGLALVKGLAELHGGGVVGRSEGVGRGAEFIVHLPLDSQDTEGHEGRAPLSSKVVQPCRRVLIIEDNVDAAESLREALGLGGHQVAVAYNGADGITRARAFRPDVVLCDIGLPGMNGYEVAQAFRADDALRTARLVALTGYALPEDVRRAAEAGFDGHVAKPPNLELLEAIVAGAPAVGPEGSHPPAVALAAR